MMQLLLRSVQGAVLIAVLLALRMLFRRRISPVIFYALWLLPAARLLIPGSVESSFSLQNLVSATAEQGMTAVLHKGTEQLPQLSHGVSSTDFVQAAAPAAADLAQAAALDGRALDVGVVLTILWGIGVVAVLFLAFWKNLRFSRWVRRGAVPVEADCPLPVYLSEGLSSPCLLGLFRPAIFLCDQVLDSQEHLEMVLHHELSHWRAGDRFWAVLRLICCAVHWFNPLVWIAALACVQDCERACDYRVLRHASQMERENYGMLLLSYVGRPPKNLLLTSSSMGAGRRALRGRIALIAWRPATGWSALLALILCVAGISLAACTERLTGESGRQRLIQLAEQMNTTADVTDVKSEELLGSISGTSFANFLSTRTWEQVENAELQGQELTLESEITLRDSFGERRGTLCFWRDDITANYYASAEFPDETEPVFYAISERDEWIAIAMAMVEREEDSLCAELPGGGEMVLVCSGVSMGSQSHGLFYTEDGTSYIPISCDLDTQYSRVAESMVFISQDVGFVTFRFEEINGHCAPNLYRTEDGGVTWQRVELPMGDITTENGYGGIHVTAIEFEDKQNGTITVGMYGDDQEGALSCAFVTSDGGRTWGAISSSGPSRTFVPGNE